MEPYSAMHTVKQAMHNSARLLQPVSLLQTLCNLQRLTKGRGRSPRFHVHPTTNLMAHEDGFEMASPWFP